MVITINRLPVFLHKIKTTLTRKILVMIRICLYCARYHDSPFKVAPLGIGYLYSYLVGNNIIDANNIRIVDSFDEVIEFRPDIVSIGSVSHVIDDARRFARQCKELLGCFTVLGGYHISCSPSMLPVEFDVGVLGEGELTFAELICSYSEEQRTVPSLDRIKGVCYQSSKNVMINPARELISDVDALPWPYRHKKYSTNEPIFTSRGCPFSCTFCASHKFWQGKTRFRSAQSVVDEISHIVETCNPKEIVILDDLWIADRKRFKRIVQLLIELGIPEKVTFRGFCRSSIVTEETILLLKKINYRVLRFGGETGSDVLLKSIKGNDISVADHQRVIDLSYKHDMECGASFMFGLPGETKSDIEKTVNFLEKNKHRLKIIGFYLFNPIPGTALWDQLAEKGEVSLDMRFSDYQLDLGRRDFDWDNLLYFNEEQIPLAEFRVLINEIKRKYYLKSPFVRCVTLLKRWVKKVGCYLGLVR